MKQASVPINEKKLKRSLFESKILLKTLIAKQPVDEDDVFRTEEKKREIFFLGTERNTSVKKRPSGSWIPKIPELLQLKFFL